MIRSLFAEFGVTLAKLKLALEADIKLTRMHGASREAKRAIQKKDGDKKIFDTFYYHLLNHDTGNTYIFIADYQKMRYATKENAGQIGVLYRDGKDSKRMIIRGFDGADIPKGARKVYLTRDDKHIFIDGVRFEIERLAAGEKQQTFAPKGTPTDRDYYQEIEQLAVAIRAREAVVNDNIFLSTDDRKETTDYLKELYSEIALTREDIQKLETWTM